MEESRVFLLFEGTCPECHHEVTATRVAGTPEFLEEYADFGEEYRPEVHTWHVTPSNSITDGEIEFKCTHCSKTFTVAHNVFGDWNE